MENGTALSSGVDLEPHTKLHDVAASEAARPASAQALQRPRSSGSQGQLAAIGLSRQLTDERTLSGYITDSDSAAEATPTLRGGPAGSSDQLPVAAQLQSNNSREALSAGVSAPLSVHHSGTLYQACMARQGCLASSQCKHSWLYAQGHNLTRVRADIMPWICTPAHYGSQKAIRNLTK